MPNPEKYNDFLCVSEQPRVIGTSAGEEGTTVFYTCIECPHCKERFEMPSDAVKKNKSSRCLEHLRVCKEFTGKVSEAPAKKRKVTNDDLLRKLEEMQEEQRATFRLVHESSGRGPPPPTTKEELAHNVETDRQEREQLERRFGAHKCSVCMDNLSQTLLLPCWHLCMCNACATTTQAREGEAFRCPICREPVSEKKVMPGL